MKSCAYIYCSENLSETTLNCPLCGTAQSKQKPSIELIRHLDLEYIIDMHQIIPKEKGGIDQQLLMMQVLKIKKVLVQSVPNLVQSISNNADLRELKSDYPDQFHVSHFMDPRDFLARKKIKHYSNNGVKVIKLLPCLGYQPDDPKYDTFWRTIEENGQIIMVHTGFITARHKDEEKKHNTFLNSRYGNPIYFDRIARKFPKMQIILCHTGGAIWYEAAVQMINQHKNVWGDCSGFGNFALHRLLHNKVKVNWNKLFWGNDSHPKHYYTNLNLLLSTLKRYDRLDLQSKLLQGNGERFINQFMD